MFTRSGKPIPHCSLYQPDRTPWGQPPACRQGPTSLAHRFPLQLPGPKAWHEPTPTIRRIAWGYGHELRRAGSPRGEDGRLASPVMPAPSA